MKKPTSLSQRIAARLQFEKLEERWTPAQFGIPWPDATHLTLSFVPDGTDIQSEQSRLSAALDAQMPRNTWRTAIVRAFQMWSEAANINVGVVSDAGQPLGTAGPSQGDSRFGDIRIAGLPMADDAIAVSIPPANATTGTFSGDMVLNTRQTFDANKLLATALHEAGHILGLDHSTDPASVMNPTLVGNLVLSAGDIAAIRGLYGAHGVDSNEVSKSNDTLQSATRIRYSVDSGGYDGSTPVVEYGDISSPTELDYLYIPNLSGYSGPITFRIQSTGISLLNSRVSVINEAGRVLQTRVGGGLSGSVVSITIPNSVPGEDYYVRVESAPNGNFRTGRYGVAVTFDNLLQPTAVSINNVLRGPYEFLSSERIDQLFKNANSILDDDLHLDDTIATAVNLRPNAYQTSDRYFDTVGSISDATDVDVYRVRAPEAAGVTSWVLTVTARGEGAKKIVPSLQIVDANSRVVPSEVIVNGNGEFAIQALNVVPRRAYFVRAAGGGATGNYEMSVGFGTVAAELNEFAAGSTSATGADTVSTLYVARSQLFNFMLDSAGSNPVTMTIRDLSGNLVHQQTSVGGAPSSAISKLILPGEYRVSFSSLSATTFRLRGSRITDPVGPIYNSPAYEPQYTPVPTIPIYVYPYTPIPTPVPYAFTPFETP